MNSLSSYNNKNLDKGYDKKAYGLDVWMSH